MTTGHEFTVKRSNKRDVQDVIWMYRAGILFLICVLPLVGYWT